MRIKRLFRKHVAARDLASYPSEDEIRDRRIVIKSLGGALIGGLLGGCQEKHESNQATPHATPGAADMGKDAGPSGQRLDWRDLPRDATMGKVDSPRAPSDMSRNAPDASYVAMDAMGGMPDAPAPLDLRLEEGTASPDFGPVRVPGTPASTGDASSE